MRFLLAFSSEIILLWIRYVKTHLTKLLEAKSRENRRACRRFSIYSLPTASYKDLFDILGRSGRPERLFFYLVFVIPDFRISGIDIFRFLCYTVIEIFRISGFPKGATPWNATSPKRSTP